MADYRVSYHHKIRWGDTVEPYAHVQGRQYWNDKSPDRGYYSGKNGIVEYVSGSDDYTLLMGALGYAGTTGSERLNTMLGPIN